MTMERMCVQLVKSKLILANTTGRRARMAQDIGMYGSDNLEQTRKAEQKSKRRTGTLPPNRIGNLPGMELGKKWTSRCVVNMWNMFCVY